MIETLKQLFDKEELLEAEYGIERESLRVTSTGKLAITSHPKVFGDKLANPYITTDFSESQVEVITPNLQTSQQTYDFLNNLYDIVALNIGDELLWAQSAPCDIPEDKDIPIASYKDTERGRIAREYREKLIKKYGGKKQLISGIHYNFSFKESFIKKLYDASDKKLSYQLFKDDIYLKMIRNYLRYRWLIVYLYGATPVFHESYIKEAIETLSKLGEDAYSSDGAMSYRNGSFGYKNDEVLCLDYSTVRAYLKSIDKFIEKGKIQSPKELYSHIRAKSKDNLNIKESLLKDGIKYIEIRSIDINPFEKSGISLTGLRFLHLFMLYILIKDEEQDEHWQIDAGINQIKVAQYGLKDIELIKHGEEVSMRAWGEEILGEMLEMNDYLGLGETDVIKDALEKIDNPKSTLAYQTKEVIKQEGYINAILKLSKSYKEDAYANRYKLYGHEGMELSTQILMKEAIKRGIKVEILDESDNFILLKQGDHEEYVKQATKTSKDSYATMLIMENKVVTKKVLARNGIRVPEGIELLETDNLELAAKRFEGKPLVVKPKSTNFGKGISIFTEPANKEDILKALEIGFKHDNTVLLEEFIHGKEYRFLVVGDETVGILHRVPANVVGNGHSTIRELVEIKNQDSLRGVGYKTPLEKIKLDESSALFLKQQDKTFDYVPEEGEVVYLRENSNISTGGDSIDYTDEIPQRFKEIAVKCAKAAGAKFCGVDMMLEDRTNPDGPYAIIEINFNPAIHIHSFPYKGKERNIAKKVLKVLDFPVE